jgi:hypothetical protein
MTYYLVSFDEKFLQFQKAHDFLKNAYFLNTDSLLQEVLLDLEDHSIFFIEFEGKRSEKDDFVLALRDTGKDIRVIYVSSKDLNDLTSHQQTPAGGDTYIRRDISSEDLWQLLDTFGTSDRRQVNGAAEAFELEKLNKFKQHSQSKELDRLILGSLRSQKPKWEQDKENEDKYDSGEDMTKKDSVELSLDDEFDLGDEFSLSDDTQDSGSDEEILTLGDENSDDFGELSLSDTPDEDLSLDEETPLSEVKIEAPEAHDDLSLNIEAGEELALSDELEFGSPQESDTNYGDIALDASEDVTKTQAQSHEESGAFALEDASELSDEVREKLKEIDAIMDGSSKIDIKNPDFNRSSEAQEPIEEMSFETDEAPQETVEEDQNINESLVSDEVNVDELNFTSEEEAPVEQPAVEESPKKKKKKEKVSEDHQSLKEISGAYSGELERLQATISNLRADRDELLQKIQSFEDNEILHKRNTLSLRAELDEKKIELSIIRRKLNEEISELKDQVRFLDEKKLISDEKIKILQQEVEKSAHRNRLDVKRVQMRERELEQKLELLKADAETQIRNRDLKILELKRKLDGMEFDMESISTQEKKSVESRFELEDKLDKAIKTLRSAITVLEDEGRSVAAETLKKNIDV